MQNVIEYFLNPIKLNCKPVITKKRDKLFQFWDKTTVSPNNLVYRLDSLWEIWWPDHFIYDPARQSNCRHIVFWEDITDMYTCVKFRKLIKIAVPFYVKMIRLCKAVYVNVHYKKDGWTSNALIVWKIHKSMRWQTPVSHQHCKAASTALPLTHPQNVWRWAMQEICSLYFKSWHKKTRSTEDRLHILYPKDAGGYNKMTYIKTPLSP